MSISQAALENIATRALRDPSVADIYRTACDILQEAGYSATFYRIDMVNIRVTSCFSGSPSIYTDAGDAATGAAVAHALANDFFSPRPPFSYLPTTVMDAKGQCRMAFYVMDMTSNRREYD